MMGLQSSNDPPPFSLCVSTNSTSNFSPLDSLFESVFLNTLLRISTRTTTTTPTQPTRTTPHNSSPSFEPWPPSCSRAVSPGRPTSTSSCPARRPSCRCSRTEVSSHPFDAHGRTWPARGLCPNPPTSPDGLTDVASRLFEQTTSGGPASLVRLAEPLPLPRDSRADALLALCSLQVLDTPRRRASSFY